MTRIPAKAVNLHIRHYRLDRFLAELDWACSRAVLGFSSPAPGPPDPAPEALRVIDDAAARLVAREMRRLHLRLDR